MDGALLARLEQEIEASRRQAEARRRLAPAVGFPPALPVSERHEEIARLIEAHQVVVVCGETGSGKSTQLPKICLTLGRGVFGRIGHTQPRRIAARSLAMRISEELGVEPGTAVGWKVRFHDHVAPATRVKLMTDGILLAEIQRDRFLDEYDTLIIDEAHERSLNIDFLLGYLKKLLPKRPDLKVIVTSATIDPERFAEHFGGAPVITVSGRTWPVEVRYRPPEETGAERDAPMQQAIAAAVHELGREDQGDILVFLSGEREIRETAETLHEMKLPGAEVVPLYARLGPADQARIFRPHAARRIVLATNVAETSLTVPGIRHVIDTGFARISRYSHRSKVQRLPVERISRASADQRKGRCGREAPGICIRLYSEEDFEARAEFTEPEILRTNLASVILQMKVLGFGEIERFPFVDVPDRRLISDGYRLLAELGAVDGERRVSRLGRLLARLPVDPRIARMLIEAAHTHCLKEVRVIAAALSIQDPRERPLDKQQAADAMHALFADERSDFVALLNLWEFLEKNRKHLSKSKFRELCRNHFISWNRVREWQDIHLQLRRQMHDMGFRDNDKPGGYEVIHRAVLTGLLGHIGVRGEKKEYLGARGGRFHIWPGSGTAEKAPKWIMAAERVETRRHYGRMVAEIRPEWIESAAGHLVKRNYSEPHWQPRRGQVGAFMRVTLYGLTLVARRRCNFGPVDPPQAREIFIRSALVEGDFNTRLPFFRHNRELRADIEAMEAKLRRHGLLVDEEAIFRFYDERIPQGIYSTPQFEQWARKALRGKGRWRLHMRQEDLLQAGAESVSAEAFPDRLEVAGVALALAYHFEPGDAADGVTLVVPLHLLMQIPRETGEWLVPGLLKEKIVALLRGLPKALRRTLVPVPDTADACVRAMIPGGPLLPRLVETLKSLKGVRVGEGDFGGIDLPEHLRMKFRLVDEKGGEIAVSHDLAALQRRHAERAARSLAGQVPRPAGDRRIKGFDFAELAESMPLKAGGVESRAWPALVDRGDRVEVALQTSAETAERVHRAGLRRLILLELRAEAARLRKGLPGLQRMVLQYAKAPVVKGRTPEPSQPLEADLTALILDRTFLAEPPLPRSGEALAQRVQAHRGDLPRVTEEVTTLAGEILDRYQRVRRRLAEHTQINWLASLEDMRAQLDRLVFQGFMLATPWSRLCDLPRYLRALEARLEKLPLNAARDRQWMQAMQPLWEQWRSREARLRESGRHDARIEEIGWLFEELRVSLFAQEVGAATRISMKRLQRRWEEMGL